MDTATTKGVCDMPILKSAAFFAAVTVLAGVPLLSAMAQTPPPAPSSPPAATKPDTAPMPPTGPAQRPSAVPRPGDKSATSPAKVNPLVGLAVFSSDGSKLGTVHSVATAPDGKVMAIHIKSGGFLGIGAKLVAIPEGKFTKSGDNIQLGMTADEVGKLPEVKQQG
jgi:hypothetical protein